MFMGFKNRQKEKLRVYKKLLAAYGLTRFKRSGELEDQNPDPNFKTFHFPSSCGYYRNPNGYEMRLHDRNELVPYTIQNMFDALRYTFVTMPNLVRMVQTDGTNKVYGNWPFTHRVPDVEVNCYIKYNRFFCFCGRNPGISHLCATLSLRLHSRYPAGHPRILSMDIIHG